MSRAKLKKEKTGAFLAAHPLCCFCVVAESQEIDHIPSQASFKNNLGPDGYGFPACERCNRATQDHEANVAYLIRRAERDAQYQSEEQRDRLSRGLRRYSPAALPVEYLTNERKLAAYHHYGFTPPTTENLAAREMAELTAEAMISIRVFSRKLCCALYHKELHTSLPLSNLICTEWHAYTHPTMRETVLRLCSHLPNRVRTTRRGCNIGRQFIYRWDSDLLNHRFRFLAQFGTAFFVFGETGPSDNEAPMEALSHSEDAATIWQSNLL